MTAATITLAVLFTPQQQGRQPQLPLRSLPRPTATPGTGTGTTSASPANATTTQLKVICANCQTDSSTVFRCNAKGEYLCDACYQYFKTHGYP